MYKEVDVAYAITLMAKIVENNVPWTLYNDTRMLNFKSQLRLRCDHQRYEYIVEDTFCDHNCGTIALQ